MRPVLFRTLAGLLALVMGCALFRLSDPLPVPRLIGFWLVTVTFATYAVCGETLAEGWSRTFGLLPRQPPSVKLPEDDSDEDMRES